MNPSPPPEEYSVLQGIFFPDVERKGSPEHPGCISRASKGPYAWGGHTALSCPGQVTNTNSALLSFSSLVSFLQSKEFMLE